MSVYDYAGFDQWGYDRRGLDAGGVPRATEHPAGLQPPARAAVLGPEPASLAALMQGMARAAEGEARLQGKDAEAAAAETASLLAGIPRVGNDPEGPVPEGLAEAREAQAKAAEEAQAKIAAQEAAAERAAADAQAELDAKAAEAEQQAAKANDASAKAKK